MRPFAVGGILALLAVGAIILFASPALALCLEVK